MRRCLVAGVFSPHFSQWKASTPWGGGARAAGTNGAAVSDRGPGRTRGPSVCVPVGEAFPPCTRKEEWHELAGGI